ncbi:hypothetical protein DBV05_g1776 [Lasiodiplodia theobromae]|uniref:PHD-type domain-containing protein n=2 Tax=Lasiodiplodia theobromae TaxID=45133 RepID=A0A5N5DNW0_9PEZI|nr:hypothetical protein DBV05_g1776 [Lasiodiplodia theobromae]
MKRKYIPGGPGGGGKWFDVVDDDKKRRSKKAKPTINRENSQHSSQMSVSSLPTPQNTDGEFIWAGLDSSTKPPLPEETPQQPTMAVQSGCTCGRVVDDDFEAISCANLDCRRREFHLDCVGLERRVPNWRCDDCES